jgi:DNA modification methylase
MLHHGDCREVMAQLDAESIDAIVTDPPYGLEFMGKEWDSIGGGRTSKPGIGQRTTEWVSNRGWNDMRCRNCGHLSHGGSPCSCDAPDFAAVDDRWKRMQQWHEAWATAAYRVLKPGAHLVAFGGTRTFHRLTCAIEDAGFEIRDCLSWLYGSGFPKSLDVSKAMDKAGTWNAEFDEVRAWLRGKVKEKGLTHGEIDRALGNENSHMASHFLGQSQPMLPTWDQWVVIKALLGVDEDIDRPPKCVGYERAIIGTRKVNRGLAFTSEGLDELPITEPASDLAREWQGWGTALKPGWEPIILARKPLIGTVAANVARHGTGAMNIDKCRIEGGEREKVVSNRTTGNVTYGDGLHGSLADGTTTIGRWPANVVLDSWDEPVLRLRYTTPEESARIIREFYRDYRRVPAMPQAYRGLSKSAATEEVLLSGVLRGVAQREHARRAAPDAREEALAGVAGSDDAQEARDGQAWAGELQLEGGSAHRSGLRDGRPDNAPRERAEPVSPDGNAERQQRDTRASTRDGSDVGSPIITVGDCSPQERHQDGQPTREPGDHGQRRPQENASGGAARVAPDTRRERTSTAPALYVLACDVPAGWRHHFDVTDLTVPSPDSAAALLDASVPASKSTGGSGPASYGALGDVVYGKYANDRPAANIGGLGDSGGPSRFFYCAKASRSERNAGLAGLAEVMSGMSNGAQIHGEGYDAGQGIGLNRVTPKANHHPTVKPIALMRWLVRLITPPGGTVLDPFLGSGTTGIAAELEGHPFVGIEQDTDYLEIAHRRITHVTQPLAGMAAD